MAAKRKLELIEPEKAQLLELAGAIEKLSKVGEALRDSRLSEKAILLLLSNMTSLSQRDVKAVLDALPKLEKTFLKE